MSIETVFAHLSCRDILVSAPWYEKLFGKPPIRRPMPGLVEWQFTDSAEVQLFEDKVHAGHGALTLGVMPLEPERQRLAAAGLDPGEIEETGDYFILRLRDPDGNQIVLASSDRT
jgi:hypothetical protein